MANFCTYWCLNGCGKSVLFGVDRKYKCTRCKKVFSKKQLGELNTRIR